MNEERNSGVFLHDVTIGDGAVIGRDHVHVSREGTAPGGGPEQARIEALLRELRAAVAEERDLLDDPEGVEAAIATVENELRLGGASRKVTVTGVLSGIRVAASTAARVAIAAAGLAEAVQLLS